MGAAAHAAARRAQALDWSGDEQDRIDRAERSAVKNSNTSTQDDPNGAVPMPPGSSPFAGYGRSRQGPQLATPNVSTDIFTYVKQAPQLLATQVAYAAEATAHLTRANDYDPTDDEGHATPDNDAALVIAMRFRNDDEAKRAASKVLERSSAKLDLALSEFSDAKQRLLTEAMEKQQPIEEASARCAQAATSDSNASNRCKEQRCHALNDMNQSLQQQWVQAYGTLYGAYATAATRYDKAMRAWIDYATGPSEQFALDQERRGELAMLQSQAYAEITSGFGPACDSSSNPQKSPPPNSDRTGDDKPGECKKVKIDVPKLASLDADCHELTFAPEIELPLSLGLTVHLTRANTNAPGTLYIGAGWDVNGGIGGVSAGAGFKVSWDNNGLVTGSGVVAQGTVSVDPELAAEVSEATGRAASKSLTLQGGYNIVNHTAFGGAY
jgi:hypothetical protein